MAADALAEGGHRSSYYKGSASDTVFNLGFEWKFGSSLKDMTSSYSSILTKNLQGMRTDIVERNYDIALAYKEKDRIVAIEHSSIIGNLSREFC
ncbi:inverse autotransporter beta domain-containing protein [Plesiomonas shigelloides subsp. oncorhynchi]|nr:inverse autotransporter beta domain-containing protein [Plesiomonas shigelloides]